MRFKAITAASTVALAIPGIALAEFDYNFVEGGFVLNAEIDDTNIDGDGFRIEGSAEVADSFFVHGQYEDYDLDAGYDGSVFQIGGGYFHNLTEDLDFIAIGQFVQVEWERLNSEFDDDGLGIGGGIRARVADMVEVDAVLNWVDLDDSGSDTYIDLRGRYYINPQFAVSLNFNIGSDTFETLAIGARYNFKASSR